MIKHYTITLCWCLLLWHAKLSNLGQCHAQCLLFQDTRRACTADLFSELSARPCSPLVAATASSAFDGTNWIVRFKRYLPQAAHHATLSQHVSGEGWTWRWVPRYNAAAAHPTDFGLVQLSHDAQSRVLSALRQIQEVRDLHPDKKMIRMLQSDSQPDNQDTALSQVVEVAAGADIDEQQRQEAYETWNEPFNWTITKRPGRLSTPFMMESADYSDTDRQHTGHDRQLLTSAASRRGFRMRSEAESPRMAFSAHDSNSKRQLLGRSTITSMLGADAIWALGYSGAGVRVGVFDTGIVPSHPHMRSIKERTNWTHQNSLSDGLGHGTFVAGVIGSQDHECPGFAPDVDLYTFKVFTDDQVSFTSWFLDAFNYAILSGIHVINLSIGGPDFLDQPFVDKVWEVTSSGILMISAIGNDGPLYGTLNNPADQSDVIGVGGIDDFNVISSFSSRGMTSWELTLGSGRVKPDVMAYSKDVHGSKIHSGCRTLSGTSVASPVVAGAVCLLASTVPEPQRWQVLNPASMKQALIEGAEQLPNLNIFEQGAGKINLRRSMGILRGYQPRASVVPAELDLTASPYMWPYSRQPLYAGALPLIFNATVLNAMGVTGRFREPPQFYAEDEGGAFLHIGFEYSDVLWPWSGYLALFIRVRQSGRQYQGVASGKIIFTIVSPPGDGESSERWSTVAMAVKAMIQPPPPRAKRILWDQFHSLKYPPGYIPRDNLDIKHDILDWHGDHLFTNYHGLYNWLKDRDYYVEILSTPATCFNGSDYGAYLLVDSEEEFYAEEVTKLAADVSTLGLNLIVVAEWYHVDSMLQMKFYDDNTRSWWTPITGGANVPALNDLLDPYGIVLGDAIVHGQVTLAGSHIQLSYGTDIASMPPGSYVHRAPLTSMTSKTQDGQYAYLGVRPGQGSAGSVAVFSDSNCLDSSHQVSPCYDFLSKLLERLIQGEANGIAGESEYMPQGWSKKEQLQKPLRRGDVQMADYSFVLKNPIQCYGSGLCSLQGASASCSDYLNQHARTAKLKKMFIATTSVAINYSGSNFSIPDVSAFIHSQGSPDPSRFGGRGATKTLYLVSIACVLGSMGMLAVWACVLRTNKSRQDRNATLLRRQLSP